MSKMLLKQYREVSIVHLKDFIDLVGRCLSIVMYAGRFFFAGKPKTCRYFASCVNRIKLRMIVLRHLEKYYESKSVF